MTRADAGLPKRWMAQGRREHAGNVRIKINEARCGQPVRRHGGCKFRDRCHAHLGRRQEWYGRCLACCALREPCRMRKDRPVTANNDEANGRHRATFDKCADPRERQPVSIRVPCHRACGQGRGDKSRENGAPGCCQSFHPHPPLKTSHPPRRVPLRAISPGGRKAVRCRRASVPHRSAGHGCTARNAASLPSGAGVRSSPRH